MTVNMDDLKRRMQKAIESLKHDFAGLRTGRANANMLDSLRVDAYGSEMPINQLASVSAPEPRMLSVNVWDASLVSAVDKAIRSSGLGLNPIVEGSVMRIPLPQLTEDRRKEMTKVAGKSSEDTKIAIRNIRRDGNDQIKKLEKDKAISEDDAKRQTEQVQKLTDEFIVLVDKELEAKNKDIMTV